MSKQSSLSRRQLLKSFGVLLVGSPLIGAKRLPPALSAGASLANGRFHTFSIVAHDPEIQAWGVAVSSKAPAAGAIVPFLGIKEHPTAEGGLVGGAIANQAFPDMNAAQLGLAILLDGGTAQEALDVMLSATTNSAQRQFGVVDRRGATAAFTGRANPGWAGHIEGDGFAVQGNTLAGSEVLDAMAETYTTSDADFWFRLFDALRAGEAAGGDRRIVGRDAVANSAAIKIVADNTSLLGRTTTFMDLRVDDDPQPIDKLEELMQIWLSFVRPVPLRRC